MLKKPKSEFVSRANRFEFEPEVLLTIDLTEDDENDAKNGGKIQSKRVAEDKNQSSDAPRTKRRRHIQETYQLDFEKMETAGCDEVNADNEDSVDGDDATSASNSIDLQNETNVTCKPNINNSKQNATESFDRICRMNATLEKSLKELKERHDIEVKTLKEINMNLVNQVDNLTNELNKQKESLKKAHDEELAELNGKHAQTLRELTENLELKSEKMLKDQLRIINEGHETELVRYRKRQTSKIVNLQAENKKLIEEHRESMQKQNDAHKRALDECKMEFSNRIENAKNNTFCVSCDKAKPLNSYVCSFECQQRYW